MKKNNYLKIYRDRQLHPFEKMMFDKVNSLISNNSRILDLGCGNGYPYDFYFCEKGHSLTGVDFCEKHLSEAKKINKNAEYVQADIEEYKIDGQYDLIMMLFSLLHLPCENHKKILSKIYHHIKPNGVFLLTLSNKVGGEIKYSSNFCDEEMYWSYFDVDAYLKILCDIGFKIVENLNQKDYGMDESQSWLILKK